MINSNSDFWRINPVTLAPAKPRSRVIRGGPLLDLPKLQGLLGAGNFDLDQLRIATDKCQRDLENERWTHADVLQMLVCLDGPADYRKSEWCQVSGGGMVACDVYVLPYDGLRQQRQARALPVYLKFSLDDLGSLTIVMVSCHS